MSPPITKRTQVGIIGAGPAGLLLARMLHLQGIDTVILESRSQAYVLGRVRAGVLEQNTIDALEAVGVGQRMRSEGLLHHGIYLQFDGQRHHIPMTELTNGRSVMVYGQQEVVRDLIEVRQQDGAPLLFEATATAIEDADSELPKVHYQHEGQDYVLQCDIIAACDGFHGIGRDAIPAEISRTFERVYPFSWLGILAHVEPSTDELIYAWHERGFAMHSMRSPTVSRLYIQVDNDEKIEDWPDARIWDELETRLGVPGWSLKRGPVFDKGITGMRSFVSEPMQHGRLFLAGDAAHIVPPTGAKGLNLAISDVLKLGKALIAHFTENSSTLLDGYTEACLHRVWRAQDFANWMTQLLHRGTDASPFDDGLQRARLEYACTSPAQSRALSENYVGLPNW